MSIMPPYHTYILYSTYVVPGLLAMVQFFYGMQSSLSMVYDREMGNMRVLLVSPFPRWFLLVSRLTASTDHLDFPVLRLPVSRVAVGRGPPGCRLDHGAAGADARRDSCWARWGCCCPPWCASSRILPAS